MGLRINRPNRDVPKGFLRVTIRVSTWIFAAIFSVLTSGMSEVSAQIKYSQTQTTRKNTSTSGATQNRQAPLPQPLPTATVPKSLSPQQPHTSTARAATTQRPMEQRPIQQKTNTPIKNTAETFHGDSRNEELLGASTSTEAMREASRKIPWNRLSPKARAKVQAVLADKTIYRRLPQQSVYCEPVLYHHFLEHPDVVVAIWEKLGITQVSLKEQRPGVYYLKETVGTTAWVEVVYRTENFCVLYAKGSYTGPFIPKTVNGEAILLLHSVFEQDEDGEPYIVAQLDAFVNIQNFGVDVFAKLFAPMLGKIADGNLEQTLAFVGNVSEVAQSNPDAVKRMALKLETIPKETRDELIAVAYQAAQNSLERYENDLDQSPYGRNLLQAHENHVRSQWNESVREYETAARAEGKPSRSGSASSRPGIAMGESGSAKRGEKLAPRILRQTPQEPVSGAPGTPKRIDVIPRAELDSRTKVPSETEVIPQLAIRRNEHVTETEEMPIVISFESDVPEVIELELHIDEGEIEPPKPFSSPNPKPTAKREEEKRSALSEKSGSREAIFKKPAVR